MRSFTERSPVIIGLVTLAFIAAGTLGAILLDGGLFDDTYGVEAEFVDAAGIRPGDSVVIAGVKSGEVSSVEPAPSGDTIVVSMNVDSGIDMPANSLAEIKVDTVLGSKSLALSLPPNPDWTSELRDADQIPVERTTTPFESIDLQDVGTELTAKTDADALNQLIASLAEITDGTRDDVTAVVTNLDDIAVAINEREEDARSLLGAASAVSTTLADRDQELLRLIDELSVVMATLEDQKDEIVVLLGETSATSNELGDLLGAHRSNLDRIFDDLDRTLEVIDRRQLDLAAGVAYSASAIEGFSGIGYSGPNRTPHPWANIFLGSAGPAGIDPLLGGCGVLDIALDVILGPDPLPCDERDGPVAASSSADGAIVFRAAERPERSAAPFVARVLEMAEAPL